MNVFLLVVDDEQNVHDTITDFVKEFKDLECVISNALGVEQAKVQISKFLSVPPAQPIIILLDHFLGGAGGAVGHTIIADIALSALMGKKLGIILMSGQFEEEDLTPVVNALHCQAAYVDKTILLSSPTILEGHIRDILESAHSVGS